MMEIDNSNSWKYYSSCGCLNCNVNQESDNIKTIRIYNNIFGGVEVNLCKKCSDILKDLLDQ